MHTRFVLGDALQQVDDSEANLLVGMKETESDIEESSMRFRCYAEELAYLIVTVERPGQS